MANASELKAGRAIRIDRQIFGVLEVEHGAGPRHAGGVVKTKLRNLASGRVWEPHFRPAEPIEELQLSRQTMEFL